MRATVAYLVNPVYVNEHTHVDLGDTGIVVTDRNSYIAGMTFGDIDHVSDVPVWVQLYEMLRKGIRDGTYAKGTPMPSAKQIQQESGLARATIAKAYNRLRDENLILVVPGRGPHVRLIRMNIWFNRIKERPRDGLLQVAPLGRSVSQPAIAPRNGRRHARRIVISPLAGKLIQL